MVLSCGMAEAMPGHPPLTGQVNVATWDPAQKQAMHPHAHCPADLSSWRRCASSPLVQSPTTHRPRNNKGPLCWGGGPDALGRQTHVAWRGRSFLCASHLPSCFVWDPQQHVSGVSSAQPPEARYVTWDCCALGLVSARGLFLGCFGFAAGSLLNMTYLHLSVCHLYSHNTPRLTASCFAVAESQAAAQPWV